VEPVQALHLRRAFSLMALPSTSWNGESLGSDSWTPESLPSDSWTAETLPVTTGKIPLTAQDGTPLTDQDGNQLYTHGTWGTFWTDE